MDRKDGQADCEVRVFVIHKTPAVGKSLALVGYNLEPHRLVPEYVLSKEVKRLVHRLARRLVLVEDVAAQEQHVRLVALGVDQHLEDGSIGGQVEAGRQAGRQAG